MSRSTKTVNPADRGPYVVLWLSGWHATFNDFFSRVEAEQFYTRLRAMEDAGQTFRGRSVQHVQLSLR